MSLEIAPFDSIIYEFLLSLSVATILHRSRQSVRSMLVESRRL